MFSFGFVWAFILLPIPWLWWHLVLRKKQVHDEHLVVAFVRSYQEFFNTRNNDGNKIHHIWFGSVWIFTVIALSQPQYIGKLQIMKTPARNIMLSVDISGSMETADMVHRSPGKEIVVMKRIDVVKKVLDDFISRRVGDRLGLVVFALHAYLHAPLTLDVSTVKQFLHESETGLADEEDASGTAIGDSIALSLYNLRKESQGKGVIILLTDGVDTGSKISPIKAAEMAKEMGIKIYTVGLGATQSLHLPPSLTHQDAVANIDEDLLIKIAQTTGGKFYRAENFNDLVSAYNDLQSIEPVNADDFFSRPKKHLYHYFLLVAFLILFARSWMLLRHRKSVKAISNK